MHVHANLITAGECRDPTMPAWRNQEPRQWPAVPVSVPGAALPVQWIGAEEPLNQGHRAEETKMTLSSVRKDPPWTARAAG